MKMIFPAMTLMFFCFTATAGTLECFIGYNLKRAENRLVYKEQRFISNLEDIVSIREETHDVFIEGVPAQIFTYYRPSDRRAAITLRLRDSDDFGTGGVIPSDSNQMGAYVGGTLASAVIPNTTVVVAQCMIRPSK